MSFLAISLLLAATPLEIRTLCSLDKEKLWIHLAIETHSRDKSGQDRNLGPVLYEISCDLKHKECDGAYLHLDKNPIEFGDFGVMRGVEIESVKGRVATVSWGVHKFVYDAAAGTVTKAANGPDGKSERGVGLCERTGKK